MVLKARRAMMEAIGTVLVSRTGGGEAGLLSGGAALELGLGVPLAAHTIDFVKTELPWLGIQYYVRQAALEGALSRLSVNQLLAAAIPASMLGGLCWDPPRLQQRLWSPGLSSFIMQQHEQEEHDGRLGSGANYPWSNSESLFHGQCYSVPEYP